MKIKLVIDKKYPELQIHICNEKDNLETRKLYQTISKTVNDTLTAYQNDEVCILSCIDVIHIYSENKNVYAATTSGCYKLRQRLYELETELDNERFIRVSNSDIVNLKKVKHLDTSVTGTIRMRLDGGLEAYVSRRYMSKIKKALGI